MSKIKLLVVDDERDLVDPLKANLELLGYEVLVAFGGHEAFEIFKSNKIDAIITDIRMPEGNGIELLNNVKSTDPSVPVVSFITGYSDVTVYEAYHMGVNSTFSKPFDLEKLADKIHWSLQPFEKRWGQAKETDLSEVKSIDSVEVGCGGICMKTSEVETIVVDNKYSFNVEVDGVGHITGQGFVRWKNLDQDTIGIEFCFLEAQSLIAVVEFIKKVNPIAYIPMFAEEDYVFPRDKF